MHDPVFVQVYQALKELVQDGFDGPCGNCVPLRLIMVMNNLKQIVFCILENNENTLVFKDYLDGMNHIGVGQLGTKCHFTDC